MFVESSYYGSPEDIEPLKLVEGGAESTLCVEKPVLIVDHAPLVRVRLRVAGE